MVVMEELVKAQIRDAVRIHVMIVVKKLSLAVLEEEEELEVALVEELYL